MAMNLDAVLRIAAKVVGLEDLAALQRGLVGAEKAAKQVKSSFGAVVNSASWQAAAVGAAGIGVALGTSVKAAMEFESAMADVRKVVPGLESAEGLKGMRQEILNLSKELPVSAEGLAAIMAAAGQAGIPREELAQFTKQAAQMGVAFDITADQAGEAMAKLRTSLGLNQKQVVDLADAMNYLSNNMASSAAEVNEFMLRAGAVGKQVAMTTEQTAALGSAMIAAGAPADVAATSFRNLIKALAKGESATDRQVGAFKRLGLDVVQVAKDMQVDAVGTIRDVFQRISRMPAEMRVSTISEIFGDEARALTPLITNMQLFDQAIGLVGDKSKYAGSMLKEFQARAGTSANNFQLLQNNLKALQIAAGEGLIPAINAIFKVLTPVLSVVSDLAGRFPALTAVVVTFAAALAGLVIAAPAIVSTVTLLKALAAIQLGATIAGWLGAIGPAIAGLTAALSGVLAWIAGTFVPAILTLFSGPVGWTVLAVAAVVAMAIAFREPIMGFFGWLWQAIPGAMSALGQLLYDWFVQPWVSLWEAIKPAIEAFFSFMNDFAAGAFKTLYAIAWQIWVQPWINLWNGLLREPVMGLINWLGTIWGNLAGVFQRNVITPIANAWTAMVRALPAAMQSASQFVQAAWLGMVNTVRNAFRGVLQFIASGINRAGSMINQLIRGFNALPGPNIPFVPTFTVPAFAEGGVVSRKTLAMVGEGGEPEYIIPQSKMTAASQRFLAGARGADVIPRTVSRVAPARQREPVINITTGPVMEFNGERYVTMRDLERGMRLTADGVYARLRTPAARAAVGIR